LNPNGGVPVCETSPISPPGQFTWQDLIALKYELAPEDAANAVYLLNQRTLGQILTMSDATGRPIWQETPATEAGAPNQFMIAGSRVIVTPMMPDIGPGATPILVGNLQRLYLVVIRKLLTMYPDASAGWCLVYRYSARIGGAVVCPGSGRLLKIR